MKFVGTGLAVLSTIMMLVSSAGIAFAGPTSPPDGCTGEVFVPSLPAPAPSFALVDASDSQATPTPFLGYECGGQVGAGDAHDWYRLEQSADPGGYEIRGFLLDSCATATIELYFVWPGSAPSLVETSQDCELSRFDGSGYPYLFSEGASWLLHVTGTGSYVLQYGRSFATPGRAGPDDCAGGMDAGGTPKTASPVLWLPIISLSAACSGSFGAAGVLGLPEDWDNTDWYRLDLGLAQSIHVTVCATLTEREDAALNAKVWYDGTVVQGATVDESPWLFPGECWESAGAGDVAFLRILGETIGYTLTVV